MDEGALAMVIMLTIFGTIAFIAYIIVKARNQERMALIERGLDASLLYPKQRPRRVSITLRLALLVIGIGTGVLIGESLHLLFRMEEGVAFPACILIGGGVGLLAAYIIDERRRPENNNENSDWVSPGPRYQPRESEEDMGTLED